MSTEWEQSFCYPQQVICCNSCLEFLFLVLVHHNFFLEYIALSVSVKELKEEEGIVFNLFAKSLNAFQTLELALNCLKNVHDSFTLYFLFIVNYVIKLILIIQFIAVSLIFLQNKIIS